MAPGLGTASSPKVTRSIRIGDHDVWVQPVGPSEPDAGDHEIDRTSEFQRNSAARQDQRHERWGMPAPTTPRLTRPQRPARCRQSNGGGCRSERRARPSTTPRDRRPAQQVPRAPRTRAEEAGAAPPGCLNHPIVPNPTLIDTVDKAAAARPNSAANVPDVTNAKASRTPDPASRPSARNPAMKMANANPYPARR